MNNYISYLSRSYEQVKRDLLNSLRTNAPEITDFNSSNILIRLIEMFAGVSDMLSYYIDRVAQETFLLTLRRFKSAVNFAKAYNYRLKGAFSAETSQRFYVNTIATNTIIIPIGTVVSTPAGLLFLGASESLSSLNNDFDMVRCNPGIVYRKKV